MTDTTLDTNTEAKAADQQPAAPARDDRRGAPRGRGGMRGRGGDAPHNRLNLLDEHIEPMS